MPMMPFIESGLHDIQPAVGVFFATAAGLGFGALWRDRQKGLDREQKNLISFMEAQAKHNQADRDHIEALRDLTADLRRRI